MQIFQSHPVFEILWEICIKSMVIVLDGISEHVAHVKNINLKKECQICACCWSKQMP